MGLTVFYEGSPEFPEDCMTGVAGEFATLYSSHLESPPAFFFFSFLTCLGSMITWKVRLDTELRTQPRLYVLLLGESSDDRKSTAISKSVDFFYDCWGDGVFDPCYGVNSAEGLQKLFDKRSSILLVYDEMKALISKAKIEGSVLMPCINTLFESNRYQAETKGSSLNIKDGYLSMLAASTLETHETMWDRQFLAIGFPNRIWIVPQSSYKRIALPNPISSNEKQPIWNKMRSIIDKVDDGMSIEVTKNAEKRYTEWYNDIKRTVHTKRIDTYATRLMLLYSVNEMTYQVNLDIVDRVIKLADWQVEVRSSHDPIDAETNIAEMEERIRRIVFSTPISNRKLQQRTHANRTGLWVYNQALENLKRSGEIVFNSTIKMWKGKDG